jgi:uncharacterized protein YjbJ (UPF0337 family)
MDESKKMQFQGKWQEMRGRVKEAWGDLTDDELDQTEGKWDQIVGAIRRRTGQSAEAIERRLNEMMD